MSRMPDRPIASSGACHIHPDRQWLQGRLLHEPRSIRHAVTLRRMNEEATETIGLVRAARRALGWGDPPIVLAEQTHGDGVAIVSQEHIAQVAAESPLILPEVDALVCGQPNVILAVFTADCVPILLADEVAGVIGAVHAGWRGTIARIVPGAVKAMLQIGASRDNLMGWIGPAICSEVYEVSEELAERFADAFPEWAADIVKGRLLDLPEINRRELLDAGLRPEHVADCGLCTCNNPELLYSYRREGPKAGRMASMIMRAS